MIAKVKRLGKQLKDRRALRSRGGDAVAYSGFGTSTNLGDRVCLEAARAIFPAHGVRQLLPESREDLLARLGLGVEHVFGGIVLGGGTLMNHRYLPTLRWIARSGVPAVAIGTGVGDWGWGIFDGRAAARSVRKELPAFEAIGVRGPLSRRWLEHVGDREVEVVGDLALALTVEELGGSPSGSTVPFCLNWEIRRYPRLLAEIVRVLRDLASRGLEPVPILFSPQDRALTAEVAGKVSPRGNPPALLRSFREFAAAVRDAHMLVGSRLHSCVLAAATGVPFVSLSYSAKCLDFAESVGFRDYCLEAPWERIGDLESLTLELADRAARLRRPLWMSALDKRRRLHLAAREALSIFGMAVPAGARG